MSAWCDRERTPAVSLEPTGSGENRVAANVGTYPVCSAVARHRRCSPLADLGQLRCQVMGRRLWSGGGWYDGP